MVSVDRDVFSLYVAGISIGISIVLVSIVTRIINPLIVITIQFIIAGPLLLALIKLFGSEFQLKRLVSIYPKEFVGLIFLRYIFGKILLTVGLSLTLAIRAGFLIQTETVFVFLFSVFILKEKITPRKLFMIIALVFGVFLITTGGNLSIFGSFLIGDLLIMLAMASLGYSYFLSKKVMEKIDPLTMNAAGILFSVPVYLILSLLIYSTSGFIFDFSILFLIAAAGILVNVVAISLWFRAFKRVKPWVIASILVLHTLTAALISFFWLGQTLSMIQLIGGLIILASVYIIGKEKIER